MEQTGKKKLGAKLKDFIKQCARVLRVTKKPSMTEFKTIIQVSALGMLIIGAVGFIITIIQILILMGIG